MSFLRVRQAAIAAEFAATVLEDRQGPLVPLEPSLTEKLYGFSNQLSWIRLNRFNQSIISGENENSWTLIYYENYKPAACNEPQNILDTIDECDHGFVQCFREGDLTNTILQFLDSLELHTFNSNNYTFNLFKDHFVYFKKSFWKKFARQL